MLRLMLQHEAQQMLQIEVQQIFLQAQA